MNCIRIQSMITPFIEDKLGIKDMEVFLSHISSCPDCREELEIYYALLTAVKQLDDDKNLTGDFEQELSEKLDKAQDRIIHAKYTYYRKKVFLFLAMILLAIFIGISYSDNKLKNEKKVSESDFRIRNEFRFERDDMIDLQLQNYLNEHDIGTIPSIK